MLLPALVAVLGPSPASAATRDVWVAAVPKTWNAVPNARDAIHGTRFDGRRDDVPHGRLPALHARLEAAGAARLRGGHRRRGLNGPLIRARVGDRLRIHFKNLDTLHDHAHSMHFHGVEYKPSSDGIWLPLFSGKGGNVKPGQSFTYRLTAGPGLRRLLAVPRPLDLDGGVDRRRHVRRALDRRPRRAPRRPRVRRRLRALARLPDDQRPRVRRQHARVRVARRRVDPVGRDGDGQRVPHLPRARPPLAHRRRHARGHARARPRRVLPRALARGRAGHVALPLPRGGRT